MFYFFTVVMCHDRSAEQTWSLLTDGSIISYHVVLNAAINTHIQLSNVRWMLENVVVNAPYDFGIFDNDAAV